MTANVHVPSEAIEVFCEKHHIRKLSLFGSVLRDDFRSDSDVDVLVEFEPGFEPTMRELLQMERALTQILGREVDLGEMQSIIEDPNYIRRHHILNAAQVIYV